ncbi:hypothetical protein BDF22DRAFT_671988 [Syncephalis plumigaleata]|nr:hypothetical protein BDF22DRAFT_671988 [Syncephalis plumigaleata]
MLAVWRTAIACLLMLAILPRSNEAQFCSRLSIRREIRKLSPTELDRFFNAVLELKRRRDGDLSIYDRFVQVHLDNTDVAHGVPSFLPWHRKFIRDFELALQRIDPSVSLPYWDWSLDSQAPEQSPIFSDHMYGGNGEGDDNCVPNGRFANWPVAVPERRCLQRSFNEKADISALYAPESLLSIQQDENTFEGFWSTMEGPPHGVVHMSIGGDMGSMTSPNDPIFWLHHSFMDKMWADWQIARPEVRLAMYGGQDDENDREALPNDRMSPWGLPVRAVLNHRVLCYNYDTTSYDDSIATARRRLLGINTPPRPSSITSTMPFRGSSNDPTRHLPDTVPIPSGTRRPVLPGTWIPGRPVPGGRFAGTRMNRPPRPMSPNSIVNPVQLPNIPSSITQRPPTRSNINIPRIPPRSIPSWESDESSVSWRADNQDGSASNESVSSERTRQPSLTRRSTSAYSIGNNTTATTALTNESTITKAQLIELANEKAKNTKKRADIAANDRENLVGLREPLPLPDWWIKMNRLSPERVRKTEAKLRRVIKDVNRLKNYLSPASLLERIRSGELLAPIRLLGDTVKETLHLVSDFTQDVPIVGDVIDETSDILSNVVDKSNQQAHDESTTATNGTVDDSTTTSPPGLLSFLGFSLNIF